ncbi:MAG: cytochrome c3 family protein [Actinobacteria bacterium]|nr:cytochrome c3 family protein [Actinomycetota bacterium]
MDRLKQVTLLAIASLITLVILAPAFAFTNPHIGSYWVNDTDPDACAQCHRTHTSIAKFLTIPFYDLDRCFTCHDGTGSVYNTQQDFSRAKKHTIAGMVAGATTQCANCHETHKVVSSSSRLLVNPLNTRELWTVIDTVTDAGYDDSGTTAGIYRWCERCHQNPLGSINSILLDSSWGLTYIPYPATIIWRTSKDPVSGGVADSGTTTGYWGYFTAAAYNSVSTSTGEFHGRATSESTTTTFYGPYYRGYPALPCTACHAKHSSTQPWMIVDTITVDGTTTTSYDMKTEAGQLKFCTACHDRGLDTNTGKNCTDCHRHGSRF